MEVPPSSSTQEDDWDSWGLKDPKKRLEDPKPQPSFWGEEEEGSEDTPGTTEDAATTDGWEQQADDSGEEWEAWS